MKKTEQKLFFHFVFIFIFSYNVLLLYIQINSQFSHNKIELDSVLNKW